MSAVGVVAEREGMVQFLEMETLKKEWEVKRARSVRVRAQGVICRI